jgi:hypothetical protein
MRIYGQREANAEVYVLQREAEAEQYSQRATRVERLAATRTGYNNTENTLGSERDSSMDWSE